MAHKRKPEASAREALMAMAIEGVKNGVYTGPKHAATELGVSESTLKKRLNGRKSRAQAREAQQQLTRQEEKALVDWISQATAAGNPVPHPYVKEMAEEIRKSREGERGEFLRPLGTTWMEAFLGRHPQLRTKLSKAIEGSRVRDVTREQILNFNREFRHTIKEKDIKSENIYNCDETGTILSLFQS